MTTTEIKKEMQNAIKASGFYDCIALTAGAKQLEKGNATICFGYIEDSSRNAEGTFKKFTASKEFVEMLQKIGGTYEREEKKERGWRSLYIRIHF